MRTLPSLTGSLPTWVVPPSHARWTHSDLVILPIEKISNKEPFLRKARESFYINLFSTQKKVSVFEIEYGFNIDKGQ